MVKYISRNSTVGEHRTSLVPGKTAGTESDVELWHGTGFEVVVSANGLGTRRCYADAGDLSLSLDRVTSFKSGNNAGYFDYEPGDGWRYRHYFPKGERITKSYGFVVHLHID